jgi:hypothetical protein
LFALHVLEKYKTFMEFIVSLLCILEVRGFWYVQGFQGADLYFERHDGQAVTCEEFLAAMFDANEVKFPTFPLW